MKKTLIYLSFLMIMFCASTFAGALAAFSQVPKHDTLKRLSKFGFGRKVPKAEILIWDIDVRPDGKGLPAGQGDVRTGRLIFTKKCALCHGADGRDTPGVKLLGGPLVSDTLKSAKVKTIGNYWPYATTLFDYIRRAMPYNQPGSLTNQEVYSLSAYLLHSNNIIKQDLILNAATLPKVVMPARKLFIMDDRKGGREIK